MEEMKNRLLSDSELAKVNAGFSYELNQEQTELKVTLTGTETAKMVLNMAMVLYPVSEEVRKAAIIAATDMDAKGIRTCTIRLAKDENGSFEIIGIDY